MLHAMLLRRLTRLLLALLLLHAPALRAQEAAPLEDWELGDDGEDAPLPDDAADAQAHPLRLWSTPFQQLLSLGGGTALLSSSALVFSGLATGAAWFAVTGLLTLRGLSNPAAPDPMAWLTMFAMFGSPAAAAVGAAVAYVIVRAGVPYFVPLPGALPARTRVLLGGLFNVVDLGAHAAALASVAALVATGVALAASGFGLAMLAAWLLAPNNPNITLGLFYVGLYGAIFAGPPVLAGVAAALVPVALVVAQVITPVATLLLAELTPALREASPTAR